MSVDFRIIVRMILQALFNFVKNLKSVVMLAKLEALFSLSYLANENGINFSN